MPRVGRHPLKSKERTDDYSKAHATVTVTTVVYIPLLSGYWKNSLDILKLFFQSLYQSTDQPFDLMVFDNGSCPQAQDYLVGLERSGKIQCLILSQRNLGKLGALDHLLSTAPGEYVAYADSDVYFLPGWLERSIDTLNAFPPAGKITALPIVMDHSSHEFETFFQPSENEAAGDSSITISRGILVPEQYIDAHRLSLGESKAEYTKRLASREDVLLKRDGSEALLSGADFQFTITRKAIRDILPLRVEIQQEQGDAIYSPVLELHLAQKGYWQLSTPDYLIHHMGNQVPDFEQELPWLGKGMPSSTILDTSVLNRPVRPQRSGWKQRVLENRFVRNVLKKVHTFSYSLLYDR